MHFPYSLLALALVLDVVSAGLFPPDSVVKMLDPKGFKKVMKRNETSMVAFVAPWCGHCQRMGPEYSKAALGLHPLVPTYAVNCDDEQNKRLCGEQGVQGFPTVKLFPRGGQLGSMTYDSGERTASAFFYWASRRIPQTVDKMYQLEEIEAWIENTASSGKPRALLLTKDKKVPLLWKVLGNKYKDQITLGSHRDRKGKTSVKMGFEAGEKKQSKVLIYPPGSTKPVRYQGVNKLEHLSKFFDSILNGTADLQVANEEAEAAGETYEPTLEELEIERQQEAQRIALAHGGFADFIDFEQAIKEGKGAGFHDSHGFGDGMGDLPKKKKEKRPDPEAEVTGTLTDKAEPTPPPTPTPEKVDSTTEKVPEDSKTAEETVQVAFEAPSPEATSSATETNSATEAPVTATSEEAHQTDEL